MRSQTSMWIKEKRYAPLQPVSSLVSVPDTLKGQIFSFLLAKECFILCGTSSSLNNSLDKSNIWLLQSILILEASRQEYNLEALKKNNDLKPLLKNSIFLKSINTKRIHHRNKIYVLKESLKFKEIVAGKSFSYTDNPKIQVTDLPSPLPFLPYYGNFAVRTPGFWKICRVKWKIIKEKKLIEDLEKKEQKLSKNSTLNKFLK